MNPRGVNKWTNMPLIERFISRVTKAGDCWVWCGSKAPGGYGQLSVGGKLQRANRVSWRLFRGEIPKGLHVLHRCDNPPCVNPEHLFLGTHGDNVRDMFSKGRGKFTRIPPKLTEDQVTKIYSDDRIYKEIAKDYGVDPSTICDIKRRKSWKKLNLPG